MDKLNEYVIYQLWLSNKQETWDFLKPLKESNQLWKTFPQTKLQSQSTASVSSITHLRKKKNPKKWIIPENKQIHSNNE